MNFDFAKMRKDMEARSERSLGFKMELEKEELALLDQNPVEMPKLISKLVVDIFLCVVWGGGRREDDITSLTQYHYGRDPR